jgi:hypothetical protein
MSAKLPEHPLRNKNFAPIQPYWRDRFRLQLLLTHSNT